MSNKRKRRRDRENQRYEEEDLLSSSNNNDDDENDDDEGEGEEDEEELEDGEGEIEDDVDDEDEDDTYYIVQEESEDGDGILRQPGDTVIVKCKNCALWKKEWAGEVHCDVGNLVSDETCHPEKFSCQSYFWPFDKAHLLEEFLSMDAPEILTINRMRIGQRRLLGGPAGSRGGRISHLDWVSEWMKKHGRGDVDPTIPHNTALNFMHQFGTYDGIDFPFEFLGVYANKVKKAEQVHKRHAGKPRGFRRGDYVEWTNLSDGLGLAGVVLRLGGKDFKGQIRVACTTPDHDLLGAQCNFVLDEWERNCAPKVKIEAKEPEQMKL